MLAGSIDDITEAALRALIDIGEQESQTLDFKRELPKATDEGKREFCADACAMANASGGDLIFGIDENGEGKAATFWPSAENPDRAQLRLQQIIESGVEPRIPGLQARAVSVGGGCVLVVRVPKSWMGPHWVKATQRFVVREGARKRPLDIPEIRSAFLRSAGRAEKIRSFRADRIGKIMAGETPVPLSQGPIGVMHIVPAQPPLGLSIDPLHYKLNQSLPVIPRGLNLSGASINLDGVFHPAAMTSSSNAGYTLFFRDGRFESVRVFVEREEQGGPAVVPGKFYEEELVWLFDKASVEMKRLRLGPPFVVFYSLLGVKNTRLLGRNLLPGLATILHGDLGQFDRDHVLIPETVVETEQPSAATLKPIFDLVWQSAGYAQSSNYDCNGNWNPS